MVHPTTLSDMRLLDLYRPCAFPDELPSRCVTISGLGRDISWLVGVVAPTLWIRNPVPSSALVEVRPLRSSFLGCRYSRPTHHPANFLFDRVQTDVLHSLTETSQVRFPFTYKTTFRQPPVWGTLIFVSGNACRSQSIYASTALVCRGPYQPRSRKFAITL